MSTPLALYVHIPWCERKCPYCDFNSHVSANIDEAQYTEHLLQELRYWHQHATPRPLSSIFFGGGTPSLFSATSIGKVLDAAEQLFGFSDNCEITLEANPGSSERKRFSEYRSVGVNRLSIGIQSFNDEHLTKLGRIHNSADAKQAIEAASRAGFERLNLDLMYALGEQTVEEALSDLETALSFNTDHLSWYQLTIEQNTEYFKKPPVLPKDIIIESIEEQGRAMLAASGLDRYEISAYSKPHQASRHNLNYWQFGDYIGIGAGAHGKLSNKQQQMRFANTRLPKDYLKRGARKHSQGLPIETDELVGEFMMNALRLREGVTTELFENRTGLTLGHISQAVGQLSKEELMLPLQSGHISCTRRGYELLNSVVAYFFN